MLAGLASPSHLILVLVLVLLLFGAKRIPDLAKSLGTGLQELREEISTGRDAKAEVSEGDRPRGDVRAGSGAETAPAYAAQKSR